MIVVSEYMNNAKFNRGGHIVYDVQRILDTPENKKDPNIGRVVKELDDLEDALYSRGAEAPQAEVFANMYALASSAVQRLVSGEYAPAASLSAADINVLKSWSSGSHLAKPPSTLSYAMPALSLMKNAISNTSLSGDTLAQSGADVNLRFLDYRLRPCCITEDFGKRI